MGSNWVETTFAEATSVKALSSHEYEANFHDDWVIGTGTRSSSFHFVCVLRARRAPALRVKQLDLLPFMEAGRADMQDIPFFNRI
jgi:hypothetical protein